MSELSHPMERYSWPHAASSYATQRRARAGRFGRIGAKDTWRTWVTAASLLAVFVIILASIQFATPDLVGNDGYYHIRMAQLIRTDGLKPTFDWLPLTVLNAEEFVDHHFLYHVLLIPFTFGDLRLGAKLASVVFPALTFLMVWWLLRQQKVPFSGVWSVGLLIVSEAFIYRMSMPRAQSLSLGVLVLGLHWLLTDRHRRLLPVAFLFVWLYNAFPLILFLSGAYVVAHWLVDRRLKWPVVVYAGLGIGLGLVINPYFPDNLLFLSRHIVPKMIDPTTIKVGSEWYPYNTTQLMENSGAALIVFLAGVLALGLHNKRMATNTATGLFAALLFGAMLFKSRRFVEYFPAFVLIFSAFAWAPIFREWLSRSAAPGEANAARMCNGKGARLRRWFIRLNAHRWVLAGSMLIAVVLSLTFNLDATRESLQRSNPYQRYAGAATWLKTHTPRASRVFQTDWDDFPRLFYYNTHNTYTLGLDPTYMQLQDEILFDLWVDISNGRVEHPSTSIARDFGSAYVFTDLKHEGFLQNVDDDPGLTEVYRDDDAVVFQINTDSHGDQTKNTGTQP